MFFVWLSRRCGRSPIAWPFTTDSDLQVWPHSVWTPPQEYQGILAGLWIQVMITSCCTCCTLKTVHSILFTKHYLLNTVHCSMYIVQCNVHIVLCNYTSYNVHCVVYCSLYIVYCTLYTLYCTLYTVHCTLSKPTTGINHATEYSG